MVEEWRKIVINIAIRVDGGKKVGLGHLMRCIALGEEFPDDIDPLYIIKESKIAREMLEKYEMKYMQLEVQLKKREEIERVKKIIDNKNINCLITDSYEIDQYYLREMKKVVGKLVSIHDYAPFAFPSDIVINGNVYAPELDYKSTGGNTEFLLGTDYTLLRKEFQDLPKRDVKENVEDILVTVGGSDNLNLTPKILKAINSLDEADVRVKVIIGSGFDNINGIIEEVEKSSLETRLIFNIGSMSEVMLESDLAISGGGSTLYELAAAGVPAITLLQAENQKLVAEGMEKEDCVINLGDGDKISSMEIKNEIRELLNDYNRRENMSRGGQKLVDGKGAKRCVDRILS